MIYRATMEVPPRGSDGGWTLSFITWTTSGDNSIVAQPIAEMERLAPFGVDFTRHRITRYDYPEINAQSISGFTGYDNAQQEIDRITRTIGRVVRFHLLTGGGVVEFQKVAVLGASPRLQAGAIAGDHAITHIVDVRWTMRRLPDNA